MIYFIRFADDGPIKIGQTINMERRLEVYKSQHGKMPTVLGVMDGGRQAEKQILEQFAHLRISRSVVNEWRDPGLDLLDFIKGSCRPWNGENDLPATRQETIYHYKADDRSAAENRQWLAELAAHMHFDMALTLDQALVHYAKAVGFTKKKPRRSVAKRKAS